MRSERQHSTREGDEERIKAETAIGRSREKSKSERGDKQSKQRERKSSRENEHMKRK